MRNCCCNCSNCCYLPVSGAAGGAVARIRVVLLGAVLSIGREQKAHYPAVRPKWAVGVVAEDLEVTTLSLHLLDLTGLTSLTSLTLVDLGFATLAHPGRKEGPAELLRNETSPTLESEVGGMLFLTS